VYVHSLYGGTTLASIERVGSLEIAQDLDFQRKEWRIQRISWVVMALLILAALLGLTGSGILARATIGDAESRLQLEYSRFDRLEAPTTLELQIAGDAVTEEQVELWVDRGYLQSVQVEQVVPEPEEVRSEGDHLTYVFGVDAPGQPVTITFDLRHTNFGPKSGQVGLGNEPALSFSQLVFP
jgi:hypothetical protein